MISKIMVSKIMITSVRMFISKDNETSPRLCNGEFFVDYSLRLFWPEGGNALSIIVLNQNCQRQRKDFLSD